MDYLFLVLMFLMVAYYVGMPTLLYVSQKIPAYPTLQPATLSTYIPELIRYFIGNRERLEAEGFVPLGEYCLTGENPDTQTLLGLLAHPETGDRALITALLIRLNSEWRPLMQSVEIAARFANKSRICTTNSTEPEWFPTPPEKRLVRLEAAQDPRELFQCHRRVVAEFAPDSPLVCWPMGADASETLRRDFQEDCEIQRRSGQLFRDDTQNVYRPTLRGAFRLTWRLLFPFRVVRLVRDRFRADALRARLTARPPEF